MESSTNVFARNATYLWEGSLPDVVECPCDIDFGNILKNNPELGMRRIFHMGSGGHHHVGLTAHSLGIKAVAITFSELEHSRYLDLLKQDPSIAASYVCYVGNMYSTPLDIFGEFDCISLFHLGESGATVPEAITAVHRALDVLKPGGFLAVYPHSNAWPLAQEALQGFIEENRISAADSPADRLYLYKKN